MFEWERYALRPEDLEDEAIRWLIPQMLVAEAITMFYGPPGQGKTWLMYALTRRLCSLDSVKKVWYLDWDNPKRQLKERRIDLLMEEAGERLAYLSKSSTDLYSHELLEMIATEAVGRRYSGHVFVLDSTRDFVDDTKSDVQAKRFMERIKSMRDAGATILLIHHATKSGKVIDGSPEFTRSVDNLYSVRQRDRLKNEIRFDLRAEKDRDPIESASVTVRTDRLELEHASGAMGRLSAVEEGFVTGVVELLRSHPDGLNKTRVLEGVGRRKDDKTAREILDRYTGTFWIKRQVRKQQIYYLKERT